MRYAGVIGDPVAHSKSPAMHNAAFATLHIDARYDRWPTTLAELPQRIDSLRNADMLGANVTIPHKRAVMPLLDVIAPSARLVGAVNTIVNEHGQLIGHNTDAEGLAAALREAGYHYGQGAIVLGAGGAARAAVVALASLDVTTISVLARDLSQAESLISEIAHASHTTHFMAGQLADAREILAVPRSTWNTLVNATPIGMEVSPGSPINENLINAFPTTMCVVDLITQETPLLALARQRGLSVMNGLPMLLHQGALAFSLWTKQPAPLDVMRATLAN